MEFMKLKIKQSLVPALLLTVFASMVVGIVAFIAGTIYANPFFGIFTFMVLFLSTALPGFVLSMIYVLMKDKISLKNKWLVFLLQASILFSIFFGYQGLRSLINYFMLKDFNVGNPSFSFFNIWDDNLLHCAGTALLIPIIDRLIILRNRRRSVHVKK